MNRCPRADARFWRLAVPASLLAGLALTSLGASALVVTRSFPPHAMRGILTVTQPPEVQMNGKADRLSPGSRIRGPNNMLVMSGALMGQALLVHYTREPNGNIHDIWILTDDEARQPAPGKR